MKNPFLLAAAIAALSLARVAVADGTTDADANDQADKALADHAQKPTTPKTLPTQANEKAQERAFGVWGKKMRDAHSEAAEAAQSDARDAHAQAANAAAHGAAARAAGTANADSHAAAGMQRAAAAGANRTSPSSTGASSTPTTPALPSATGRR
jgi:hypothetical protein